MGITVIGIDPGSRHTGWGIVSERSGILHLEACGAVSPKVSLSLADRIGFIFTELHGILKQYAPDEASIEQVFTAVNIASALKLGQARGAAVAACAFCGIPVFDYAPTVIKKAVVGTGSADKAQVAYMAAKMLGIAKPCWSSDTGDAIGMALCRLAMRRFEQLTSKSH
ncbi:MAG: crossover junction endodeoxyribonuclease RuvC [Desulfovibrionaceae bacterium]|nr:crossover junction endodeoxyribonuclease RuvC [Desulfovibrionaceae bacterium]